MPPKPLAISAMELDRKARTYMIGHQQKNKKELRDALQEAETDPELTGRLRQLVLDRYHLRIAGRTID